jgi:hypothetical protein
MFDNELYKDIAKLQEEALVDYERRSGRFWEVLSEQAREHLFYEVVRRIVKAEVQDQVSYRQALEDIGVGRDFYGRGIDCGYIALHQLIRSGIEREQMSRINRFEVIDDKGRTYVKYLTKSEKAKFCLQDNDKTLKVFIDES